MNNAKPIELVIPISAVVFSLIAASLKPLKTTMSPGLMRWISIVGFTIQPWVLLIISVICAGVFSLSIRKGFERLKFPVLGCSVVITCLSILSTVVSLSCLLTA